MKKLLVMAILLAVCVELGLIMVVRSIGEKEELGMVSLEFQGFFKRWSRESRKVKEECQSVENPSACSIRIASSIVGSWRPFTTTTQGMTPLFISFAADGTVSYAYQSDRDNNPASTVESYQIIHRGSPKRFPGRNPNLVISSSDKGEKIIVLTNVSVGYDNRFSMKLGELLKFSDMEGNKYVFRTKLSSQ